MLRKTLAALAIIILFALSIGMSPMSASAETIDDPTRSSIPPLEKGAPTPDNPETGCSEPEGLGGMCSPLYDVNPVWILAGTAYVLLLTSAALAVWVVALKRREKQLSIE